MLSPARHCIGAVATALTAGQFPNAVLRCTCVGLARQPRWLERTNRFRCRPEPEEIRLRHSPVTFSRPDGMLAHCLSCPGRNRARH